MFLRSDFRKEHENDSKALFEMRPSTQPTTQDLPEICGARGPTGPGAGDPILS